MVVEEIGGGTVINSSKGGLTMSPGDAVRSALGNLSIGQTVRRCDGRTWAEPAARDRNRVQRAGNGPGPAGVCLGAPAVWSGEDRVECRS